LHQQLLWWKALFEAAHWLSAAAVAPTRARRTKRIEREETNQLGDQEKVEP
jgi:hypothetical protein